MATKTGTTKSQNSASFGGGGGSKGPGGGSLSAPVRTAPSSAAGAGGASSGRTSTGGPSRGPTSAPSRTAPSSGKAPSSAPKTGSGQIGSKGGGASTQRPGAGTGPAKASSIKAPTTKLQSYTAGSNLAGSRQTAVNKVTPAAAPKPSVTQGFIRSAAEAARNPTGGVLAAPARTAPSTGRTPGPTVKAGSGWTNPAGVPASVQRALAARGFNPDGTRMQPGMISRNPFDRTKEVQQERARLNDQRGVIARNPFDVTRETQQQRARANDGRLVVARNPFDVSREVSLQRDALGIGLPARGPMPGTMTANVPGLTAGNPGRVPPGLTYQGDTLTGSLMGMQPTGPTVQQAIARDPIGFVGPRVGTVEPGAFADPQRGFPATQHAAMNNILSRVQTGAMAPRAPKIADRVAPSMPGTPGTPGTRTAQPAPRPTARPPDLRGPVADGSMPYPGADGVTGADIGGVFANPDARTVAPAGMQNAYTVQRGDTLSKIAAKNGTTVQAIAEANGISNPNRIAPGQTLSIPTDATIQPMGGPMEIDIPGQDAPAPRPYPFSNFANESLPPGYRATYLDRQQSQEPVSESPSQGDFVSPSQDDRRPQTVGEAVQRFRYDRDNAREGARGLPGRVLQAIISGDMTNPDGFGNFPAMTGERNPREPQQPPPPSAYNDLMAQLLAAMAQQQQPGITSGNQSQMDLIKNTFV
ncbi:MAG: LysM peptidoglycan-binding domain-containing protein [Mizugakiibacter sp.]|uniref:LysM peptidoglycan-binding domain-containing protein n=1 Tax=Mizugakiibacter sp. TaxID=1972610 RepID=UPI00320F2755